MYQQERVLIGDTETLRISDVMKDGTRCTVLKPENWNGILLLDLDGTVNCTPEGPMAERIKRRLLAYFREGYAYGGIERDAVGYRFPDAVDMLVDVRNAFSGFYGEPRYTIAVGGSRGAFVGRFCMEMRPDVFSGALVYGGGGSGEIAAINSKLDGKFVMNVLLQPDEPLTLAYIRDLKDEERKLHLIVEKAKERPEGRARLALSAAIEQLPAWADPRKPEPAADDYEEQFRQLLSCFEFAQFNFGSYVIEQLVGGPFSWNDHTDYEDLLLRCGRKDFVLGMYEAAGLGMEGLKEDLLTLAAAPRIHAAPEAVRKAEKILSYSGTINGPIVNLENIGDQVDPESCKYAYRKTLEKRGNEDLLRVLWVRSSGHCHFTDSEILESLKVLIDRIQTGVWNDLSPEKLNASAVSLFGQPSHFFHYEPAEALHEWDFENWGSYH